MCPYSSSVFWCFSKAAFCKPQRKCVLLTFWAGQCVRKFYHARYHNINYVTVPGELSIEICLTKNGMKIVNKVYKSLQPGSLHFRIQLKAFVLPFSTASFAIRKATECAMRLLMWGEVDSNVTVCCKDVFLLCLAARSRGLV